MSSSAISAQGTLVEIGTGSGSAVVPTAIAVGFPTILTKTAHGLTAGTVVALSGFTGADAADLNGKSVAVKNITANTFAVNIDTTGATITVSGSPAATPVTYTEVVNVKDFTGFDGTASEIDVTNLQSTAKEFRLGLVDSGQFTMNLDYDDSNNGHQALRSHQIAGSVANFRLTLPNADVVTFTGYVKKFGLSGGVDQVAKTACDIRISGAVSGLAA